MLLAVMMILDKANTHGSKAIAIEDKVAALGNMVKRDLTKCLLELLLGDHIIPQLQNCL